MGKEKISHKELLTFSNLTNLEWEFVDLKAIEEGDEDALGAGISADDLSTQLNDLLTPEVFARRDAEERIEEFVYMEEAATTDIDELRNEVIEKGRIRLRQEAGIAMEYLEKSDEGQEGEFINDWEVVYAADNYKVVEDYIDTLQEFLAEFSDDVDPDDEPYPSREELEEMDRMERIIEVGFKFAEGALNVATDYLGLNGEPTKKVVSGIKKDLIKRAINEAIENLDSLPLEILGSVFLNADELNAETILSMIKDGAGPIAENLQDNYEYDVKEVIDELRAEKISDDELGDLV